MDLLTIVPLTELVHYFNKRNRLDYGGAVDDLFEIVDRRVRLRLGKMVLGSRYQPVLEQASCRILGHEALLHPLGGNLQGLPPQAVFLEARDDGELIRLDRAVRTLHALNFLLERDQHDGFLSLNVHPQLIRAVRDQHGHVFESVLSRCGLTPERIVLELSDDGLEHPGQLKAAIAAYRERGYRVAIDNFGRHSCDVDRLAALMPDIVKLDRGFALRGPSGSVGKLSRQLRERGIKVVGHGVDTAEHLDLMVEAGVDWLQGHLIARPAANCRPVPRPQRKRAAA